MNMKQIAAKLGVSQATVSNAINGKPNVSEHMRSAVLNEVERLGYEPNRFARALKTNRSRILSVIVPSIEQRFFNDIIYKLEQRFRLEGYVTMISSTDFSGESELEICDSIAHLGVEGAIILCGFVDESNFERIIGNGIPLVVIDNQPETPLPGVSYITTDDACAAGLIAEHLQKRMAKRAYILSEPRFNFTVENRIACMSEAMAKLDMHVEVFEYSGDGYGNLFDMGVSLADGVLNERGLDCDVLVCSSGELTCGVEARLLEAGVRIPRDVMLLGYDKIDMNALFRTPITTISQPKDCMAELAAEELLSRIDMRGEAGVIMVEPALDVRASTMREP